VVLTSQSRLKQWIWKWNHLHSHEYARSGVLKLIHNKCPHLYDVGCICHLADLTITAGMNSFLFDVDQLLVELFYIFARQQKKAAIWWELAFTLVIWASLYSQTLHHSLVKSLALCQLLYWPVWWFEVVFSILWRSWNDQSQKIIAILYNPLTTPILQFLSYMHPFMDKFNKVFQTSKENTAMSTVPGCE